MYFLQKTHIATRCAMCLVGLVVLWCAWSCVGGTTAPPATPQLPASFKDLPAAYRGIWSNTTYYDSLQHTQSLAALAAIPCAVLNIDTAFAQQIALISSQHQLLNVPIAQQPNYPQSGVSLSSVGGGATLELDATQQQLVWKDGQHTYRFDRLKPCLYDDAPLKYQLIARCPLNAATLSGWYYLLDAHNQPTQQVVAWNGGGAVRGLGNDVDMYRICVDSTCHTLAPQLDMVYLTAPEHQQMPIDSTDYSRYYAWQFAADTLLLYHTRKTTAKTGVVVLERGDLFKKMLLKK